MRGRSFCYTVLFVTFVGAPPATRAQGAAPSLGKDEISTLAKVQVAIDIAHDSMDLQLAMVGNKKPEVRSSGFRGYHPSFSSRPLTFAVPVLLRLSETV